MAGHVERQGAHRGPFRPLAPEIGNGRRGRERVRRYQHIVAGENVGVDGVAQRSSDLSRLEKIALGEANARGQSLIGLAAVFRAARQHCGSMNLQRLRMQDHGACRLEEIIAGEPHLLDARAEQAELRDGVVDGGQNFERQRGIPCEPVAAVGDAQALNTLPETARGRRDRLP